MQKKVLSEQFVITHKVSDLLKIDKNAIIKNCITNHFLDNRVNNEEWYDDNNYCKVNDHQHLAWMHDYIRDHYRGEYGQTPVLIRRHGLVIENNSNIGSHHHIDDWDYQNSPEISVLWCLTDRKLKNDIMFEYEFGRNKKRRWKVQLEKNVLVIFPSYLRHRLTKNLNKDPIVALSFQFQLL